MEKNNANNNANNTAKNNDWNEDGKSDAEDNYAPDKSGEETIKEDAKESAKSAKFLIWAVVIIIALFISAFFLGKLLYQPKKPESYTYNGFEFTRLGDLWNTEVQLREKIYMVPLHYGPKQVEFVKVRGELNDSFYTDEIYITFDPKNDSELRYVALSAAELSINMVQALGYRPVSACTSDTVEACKAVPTIDCDTPDVSVIYIQEEGEPEIIFNNRCIIVKGTGPDLVKATDLLVLKWYGVIKKDNAWI